MRISKPGVVPNQALGFWMFCLTSLSVGAASTASCLSARDQTELNLCMGEQLAREEQRLNDINVGYLNSLSELQRQQFRYVQDSWRIFMHKNCEFESAGHAGGTLHQTVIANCEARLVRNRYEEIEFLKRCGAESLGCTAYSASN